MLNISKNSIRKLFPEKKYKSLVQVESRESGRTMLRITLTMFVVVLAILFLPWTQNIRSNGVVTALSPKNRPQWIETIIDGRIEKWYVAEGQYVEKGDTILFISEVKEEYMNPYLLKNTEDRLVAKEGSVKSYMEKANALDNQIDALIRSRKLKLKQAENKLKQSRYQLQSDSMDYQAGQVAYTVAEEQFKRYEKLHEDGLISKTDYENRKLKLQEAKAKMIALENGFLSSQNEVLNVEMEIAAIEAEFSNKLSNTESEKYATFSRMYDAEAEVTKLQNDYMSYSVRSGYYYILAPQNGYITRAAQTGIGENVKAGDKIITIMPSSYDLAVEMYARPIDLPLIHVGNHVRVQFDGWPAIVFSGWPNVSYGTYGGTVTAIDNFVSENGMYRILVSPDTSEHHWPDALRVGSGARTLTLLKDVPIWYELWRQINGFPPDFYKSTPEASSVTQESKVKAPK